VPGKAVISTPVSVPVALIDALALALSDPHVGLTFLDSVPRGSYGVVEFLVRATTALREAFQSTARFSAIMAPSQRFTFEEGPTESTLSTFCSQRPGALGRHLNEYTLAILARTLFSMAPGVALTRVWFVSEPVADLGRLRECFGEVPIEFEQPSTGFAVRSDQLGRVVEGGDDALRAYLEEQALSALASRPKRDDLIDQLRHFLRDALKTGEPSIERLSARLGLSGRTLQRRLAELQTSFQQVLDEVRFDLARAYLVDVRLDVSQIAYLLGYSELRAFDRAFRRWAGRSPSEWRSQR
jgi:AraC-like DNA-binding protein